MEGAAEGSEERVTRYDVKLLLINVITLSYYNIIIFTSSHFFLLLLSEAAGFSIDVWGFPEMLQAVKRQQQDASVRRLSEDVERLLRFEPGDLFGARAGALKQSSAAGELEVQVLIIVSYTWYRIYHL